MVKVIWFSQVAFGHPNACVRPRTETKLLFKYIYCLNTYIYIDFQPYEVSPD